MYRPSPPPTLVTPPKAFKYQLTVMLLHNKTLAVMPGFDPWCLRNGQRGNHLGFNVHVSCYAQ